MPAKFTVFMVHKKSTKGTEVYENKEEDTPVTALYIRKVGFAGQKVPAVIQITVEGVSPEGDDG